MELLTAEVDGYQSEILANAQHIADLKATQSRLVYDYFSVNDGNGYKNDGRVMIRGDN